MERAARAVREVRRRPRHLVLTAAVAGLLAHQHRGLVVALALALAVLARRPPIACACALAVLGGGLAADLRVESMDRTALAPHLGHELTAPVVLLEPSRPRRFGGRAALVELQGSFGRGERVLLRTPGRLRWPPVAVGAVLEVRGRLAPLPAYERHHHRRGAHAMLAARAIALTGARRDGIAGALDRLRERAESAVTADLPSPLDGLALGMVLGRDENLAEGVREDFRVAGLAHLLAASGQNVMLLAALALPLLAAAGLGLRGRLLGALALIALYVPLAGAGASIQRAGVMGAAAMVAALAGRPTSRWYALLLAAAATLLVNPRASEDPGWQLSFAAVIGIVLLSGRWRDALVTRRVPSALAEALGITAAAGAATAPLLAFHFQRVSLVSLPANLLAVPAVAPVMWLGMVSVAAQAALPGAATALNGVARFPLAYLASLADAAARVPAASVDLGLGSVAAVAAAYLTLAALLVAWPAVRRRRAPVAAALAAAVLVAAAVTRDRPSPPDPRDVTVSFLDIGQGDATLIQHGRASVLVDAGPPDGPVLARLREAGVSRIDVLVATHAQADHDGGAAAVVARHPVGLLLDGGDGRSTPEHRRLLTTARRRGVRAIAARAGQSLQVGPLALRVLWPPAEPAELHAGEDPNLRALVIHVRAGQFDLLLPADAESDVTTRLDLPAVEALKVAHHGSEDRLLPELLSRLRPRVAVIEVGRRNTYGHPTAQALSALRSVPAVYRTDRDGTVRLVVRDGRMSVATAR